MRQADGSFLADARAQLEDVVATVGPEFDVGDVADEVDTLAGYVMTQVGRLPSRGEVVPGPGDFEIEVLDADPRRLKRVRITRRKGRPERRERAARRRDAGAPPMTAPPSQPEACRPTRDRRERTVTAWLARFSHAVVLSWGWRRAAIAFMAGAVSVLALAPVNAWPVLFVTFPVAVWLIDGASAGRLGGVMTARDRGWWFGFGYFVAGLYWIGFAFLVDAKTFAWLLPFAVLGLPAALAFFIAAAFGARARCSGCADRCAFSRSRSRSRRPNGCAAMCSPAFPGTRSAMRSPGRWCWRRPPR